MVEPSANRYRTALHNETIPDGPLTPRQRRIADAVRLCNSLSDFAAAEKVRMIAITVSSVPYGANKETAERIVTRGLAAAQRELDRLKGLYHVYGVAPFSPETDPVPARPLAGATRHEIVVNAMQWADEHNSVLTRAGDTPLQVINGSYEVGE